MPEAWSQRCYSGLAMRLIPRLITLGDLFSFFVFFFTADKSRSSPEAKVDQQATASYAVGRDKAAVLSQRPDSYLILI